MIVKKWLSILLLLGFMAPTLVYAYDDEDEDEEEEEAPKKSSKKKTASKKAADSDSRIGLSVGFNGYNGVVSFVYDMGTGMELGLGLGVNRWAYTPDDGNVPVPDPAQDIYVVPSLKYSLGKSLLDYGFGVDVFIELRGERHQDDPLAGTNIVGFPNFYASAELVKNVSLSLHAGIDVEKVKEAAGSSLNIFFRTKGVITFYFM
jgi:hypothetical protein